MDGEAARRKLRLRLVLARLGPEHLGAREAHESREPRAVEHAGKLHDAVPLIVFASLPAPPTCHKPFVGPVPHTKVLFRRNPPYPGGGR
jgi:hypothetical protein